MGIVKKVICKVTLTVKFGHERIVRIVHLKMNERWLKLNYTVNVSKDWSSFCTRLIIPFHLASPNHKTMPFFLKIHPLQSINGEWHTFPRQVLDTTNDLVFLFWEIWFRIWEATCDEQKKRRESTILLIHEAVINSDMNPCCINPASGCVILLYPVQVAASSWLKLSSSSTVPTSAALSGSWQTATNINIKTKAFRSPRLQQNYKLCVCGRQADARTESYHLTKSYT